MKDPGVRGTCGGTPVTITFCCTACGATASIHVPWGLHHALPKGWRSRDAIPTLQLARRTDHIFACSLRCARKLDPIYAAPKEPKWFRYA